MPRATKKTAPAEKPVNPVKKISAKAEAKKKPAKQAKPVEPSKAAKKPPKVAKKPAAIIPVPVSPFRLVLSWATPARVYALAGLAVLLASAWYWALLGARIHMDNSDQLVNTYLFNDTATFHGAQWPDQHAFLLKWPVFLAIRLFGATPGAFTAFTVGLVLATVGLLAFILYRIERRPLAFGTLCLALASVLLLVPTQPYPGGILPVNMAMVTTRNIEYLVFIAAIAAFAYAPRMRHWKFGAGIVLLIVLIASDKLFLTLGAGGAAMALAVYVLTHKWPLVRLCAKWLAASVISGLAAIALLWALNASGLTNIAGGTVAGPYGVVHTMKELMQGAVYMVLGLLTNLGANPATDTRLLAAIPGQIRTSMTSVQALALALNAFLALGMAVAAVKLLWSTVAGRADRLEHDKYFTISVMLVWATLAACGVFVVSKHYYPVDARYLTIALFTGFIVLATVARSLRWRPRVIVGIGLLLAFGIVGGVVSAGRAYTAQSAAMAVTTGRDALVAKAVAQHHVDWLVGDYWRVFPVKLETHNKQKVMPLGGCAQPSGLLTSDAWRPDVEKHSFAYLLTSDTSLTGYPPCSLDQIIRQYGRPNASTLIAGTLDHPQELLLFYDRGARRSASNTPNANGHIAAPATVVPIDLADVPILTCNGSSVMNVVAHQDDDLLFMSPDLLHSIRAGDCVRTVYVTSGDAGAGKYYWLGRQQGSEAAYSSMLGIDDIWIERLVRLPGGQIVTIAMPRGNPQISLIFMHLPDGNIIGQGFASSYYESLAQLDAGNIAEIHAVDNQAAYTGATLSETLTTFMQLYQPSELRTQSNATNRTSPDHSDHRAVGRFVQRAYADYLAQQFGGQPLIPLSFYTGYPVRGMAANIAGQDLQDKERAFFVYARFDGSVCHSEQQCMFGTNYGAYLTRQYLGSY
jgi:LmbE family N-acetylglucosaminyl deacetylase